MARGWGCCRFPRITGSCPTCISRNDVVVVVQSARCFGRASTHAESEFLARVTAVHGWVLDFDNQHGAWHIFLFCFLRDIFIPSEHMVVISCIPTSMTFGDLLVANRCGTLRSLVDDSELEAERAVLQVVALHSKLLQLQTRTASVEFSA